MGTPILLPVYAPRTREQTLINGALSSQHLAIQRHRLPWCHNHFGAGRHLLNWHQGAAGRQLGCTQFKVAQQGDGRRGSVPAAGGDSSTPGALPKIRSVLQG